MKKTIQWYEKRGKGSYFDPKLNHFIDLPTHGFDDEIPKGSKPVILNEDTFFMHRKRFWISVRKAENCLFSRRLGYQGKIIRGYSVCVRLFNIDIL
jgi:hypothetical protein